MTQLLSHRISFIAPSLFLFLGLFSIQIQSQICMDIPGDLEWTCSEEDDEFIYQNNDGVTIYDCLDPSIDYELTLDIDVEIEELGCVSPGDPGVLRRISRTFVYETGDPLDVSCPLYGPGFVCATQVIEVTDTTAPTFSSVTPTVQIECDVWDLEVYLKDGSFGLVFDDNCGIPELEQDFEIVEESECSAEKSFIWTFTLTDLCSNSIDSTHVVNVVDTTDPEIIFLPIVSEVFNCVDDVVWPQISAFDMCSSSSVNWDGEPIIITHDCPNNLTLTREATATDACGNTVTGTYSIEVNDSQSPQFIVPLTDLTIQCNNTAAIDLALSDLPTFGDGCNDGAFLNVDSIITEGFCPQNYTIEKTFVVEDACGNTSEPHIITITVEDTEAPTITVPTEGFEIECGQPLVLEAPDVDDNCDGNPTLTETLAESGDLSDNNLISTTTYTATDACGNSSESEVVVNIVDTQPPFFTSFPENLQLLCGDDYPNDAVSYEDACDQDLLDADYDLQFDFQPCANNTEITRTFTISDAAGNETTQTQSITFLDEDPPILLTPLDSLFYQCDYEVPDCYEMFEGLEFDDCSSGDVVPIECFDVVVEGNCEEQACIKERTYYFMDACGNQGSAKQYITVQESVLNPEMPTGITPNGDGLNDAFVIKGIGPPVNPEPGEIHCDWLEDTKMRVINRWGSLVFEYDNYRNEWEGTNESGEDLPEGTYFVVFEALGESFSTYLDLRR
jgi:gliding motility-associated-like protein